MQNSSCCCVHQAGSYRPRRPSHLATRGQWASKWRTRTAHLSVLQFMGSTTTKVFRNTTMANSAEIKQFIKDAIAQDKVVVFSKSYCPYCTLAKNVFEKVKQPFKVYELNERDDGDAIQANLAELTGFRTVPQVFINGNCVGGGSDVKALYDSGKLEPMLIG
ncbi:unnamed protein product, partial [Iphiclides podalirius]